MRPYLLRACMLCAAILLGVAGPAHAWEMVGTKQLELRMPKGGEGIDDARARDGRPRHPEGGRERRRPEDCRCRGAARVMSATWRPRRRSSSGQSPSSGRTSLSP
ncbi:hypothetical protein MMSR116_14430 [Methylobacterium mesophilicum SR1.6/6]|uniref:DUF4198 domain-containing protein n=1 Tax=Methylobacterium mesophilicum SR1.6/6 TaxID=908290 RepID=A0A6B9FLQ8_9HYPH|nr:hypothetical protein MMSR116_14430 [Methylobacterium mesophilicum SR1.6/6]